MRKTFGFLVLVLTFCMVPIALAGTNYNCQYPVTITLDGNLADWAGVEFILVPHDKGTGPAPDDADASLEFAAVADDDWLYVVIDIKDDTIISGESDNWEDDSVEIYIDANHARTETYEDDDAQITIGAASIGQPVASPVITGSSGAADIGTQAAVVTTAGGWIVESAIPLICGKWSISPAAGNVIGFNVHFNDDDDNGGRDHKLIWSDLDVDDASWNNPTRFADLTFIGATAVEASGKLATRWAAIKK
jgi:hypothetical protein